MRTLALFGLAGVAMMATGAMPAQEPSDLKTELVDYKDGDVALQGYLAWNPATAGPRPAVIVFHDWRGHGDYVRRRADQLARLGYLAFAADMYGKGVYAKDHDEAGKLAGNFFKDRQLMRRRAKASLDVLAKHPICDPKRIAAMGYCFGGTTSLEMARAGFDVRGVASFHGMLATPEPAKEVKAQVIVFHGKDDKFVPEEQVRTFEAEMKAAKANYKFIAFEGAVHSFTVKEAGDDPSKGMAYNEEADKKSWGMLETFLKEVLK